MSEPDFIELTVDGKPIAFAIRHIESVAPMGAGTYIKLSGNVTPWAVEESYQMVMRLILIGRLDSDPLPHWLDQP